VEFVTFKADQLRVEQRVLDVFVAEHFHDVKDVSGFVEFHCGFPVSEGVEGYSADSIVLEFVCYVGSLDSKVSCEVSAAAGESFICFGAEILSPMSDKTKHHCTQRILINVNLQYL